MLGSRKIVTWWISFRSWCNMMPECRSGNLVQKRERNIRKQPNFIHVQAGAFSLKGIQGVMRPRIHAGYGNRLNPRHKGYWGECGKATHAVLDFVRRQTQNTFTPSGFVQVDRHACNSRSILIHTIAIPAGRVETTVSSGQDLTGVVDSTLNWKESSAELLCFVVVYNRILLRWSI